MFVAAASSGDADQSGASVAATTLVMPGRSTGSELLEIRDLEDDVRVRLDRRLTRGTPRQLGWNYQLPCAAREHALHTLVEPGNHVWWVLPQQELERCAAGVEGR